MTGLPELRSLWNLDDQPFPSTSRLYLYTAASSGHTFFPNSIVFATSLQISSEGHYSPSQRGTGKCSTHLYGLAGQLHIGVCFAQYPLPSSYDLKTSLSIWHHDVPQLLIPPRVSPFGSIDHQMQSQSVALSPIPLSSISTSCRSSPEQTIVDFIFPFSQKRYIFFGDVHVTFHGGSLKR